ncbi:hypothetical protein Cni_G18109 [Canna indica]|uniref:Kinesin light chain n=1 Tax=Canna indica TaxID=4628 RepID=A0AAQ3KNW3_9LILI|nr:hypothetical protein Cni_G18109 [Canna indica]
MLVGLTWHYNFGSGFTWKKHQLDLMLGIILSGQTVLFLGSNQNFVFAQDSSVAEVLNENDGGQEIVTGFRRIEDGSVVSNVHTSKWRVYTDKGRDLVLEGKLDEAEKFFHAALDEAKKGFGVKDPHVASSCNNLAELYRVKKEYDKAEPLYLEAISILEETYGTDDVRVGAALHNLGQFYLALKKLEQAQKCYERALKLKGRVLGYDNPDYAHTMYHLGRVLHLQGKVDEVVDLIRESIRILEDAGLGESTTCLKRMKYFVEILLNSHQLTEAEIFQRKILHNLELSKGWDSLETVIAAEHLALTIQYLGNMYCCS